MRDGVTIYIRIDHSPFALRGEPLSLCYEIGKDQAMELGTGRQPPEFDEVAFHDWRMRRDRAEALAKHIAADLAHKLLQAFEPRQP